MEAKRICNRVIKKAKKDYECNVAENIKNNNKPFWKYVRTKMKTKEIIGNLQDNNGQVNTGNLEKAEILNKFFTSVFTKESLTNLSDFPVRTDTHLDTIDMNTDFFFRYIKKLKILISVGPDNFRPKFLAETSEKTSKLL